jgi:hypothetical protein
MQAKYNAKNQVHLMIIWNSVSFASAAILIFLFGATAQAPALHLNDAPAPAL